MTHVKSRHPTADFAMNGHLQIVFVVIQKPEGTVK
jgi:hypothetical protein